MFPMEDEEPAAAGCPSQNMASLGLGGLGKERELSSREAWFRGGGGSASPEPLWEGQGPSYQQSSRRLSGSGGPAGGQGRPEHEGSGGALGGRGADSRGPGCCLLFFSTSSRHWTGTEEAGEESWRWNV